jgi:hypothetical protein
MNCGAISTANWASFSAAKAASRAPVVQAALGVQAVDLVGLVFRFSSKTWAWA